MNWFLFLLLLLHLKPPSFEYVWPMLDTIFDLGQLASALLILYLHLLKKKIPSKPIWVLLIFQGWLLSTTYLNGGNLRGALLSTASILAVAMLIDLYSNRMTALIGALMVNLEIMIYLNLLSVLIYYPNGLYITAVNHNICYFLGYHNSFILYSLPAICVALLYWSISGKKGRSLCLIVASVTSILITWSATSISALFILGITLLLSRTKLRRWLTVQNVFLVTIVADLAVSVFRVMDKVMWVAWIIESTLKKQITLTGRTFIWDDFYELFWANPWIGYGADAVVRQTSRLSAHNQWFQFLLMGGMIALLLFLVFHWSIGSKLDRHQKHGNYFLFCGMFAAIYTLFIADVYMSTPWLYMIYILAYHIDKFEAISPVKKQERRYYVTNKKLSEKC